MLDRNRRSLNGSGSVDNYCLLSSIPFGVCDLMLFEVL